MDFGLGLKLPEGAAVLTDFFSRRMGSTPRKTSVFLRKTKAFLRQAYVFLRKTKVFLRKNKVFLGKT